MGRSMEDSISCIRGTEGRERECISCRGKERCTCPPDTFVPAGEGPGALSRFISILKTLVHCTQTDRQTLAVKMLAIVVLCAIN